MPVHDQRTAMTDPGDDVVDVVTVVVPYSRFIAYQDRRRSVPDPPRPDHPPTTADVAPALDVKAPCSIG
jgi:hypothetical protein